MVGVNFATSFLRPDGRRDTDTSTVLVVAPTARQALATAGEPTVVLAGTHGALTVRADLATLGPALASTFGIQLGSLDEAVAYATSDRQGIRATIRVGIR